MCTSIMIKLIRFNGISTLDGYSAPNPVYTYMISK